jgi:hypothetical protein
VKVRDYIRRHPVGVYFCSAFFISWVGSLLTGGPIFLRGESVEPKDLWAMGILMLAGTLRDGARHELSRRWETWSPRPVFPDDEMASWWTLVCPAVDISHPALGRIPGAQRMGPPELSPTFFAPSILMGLLAGPIEEVGWMGFAFPSGKVIVVGLCWEAYGNP